MIGLDKLQLVDPNASLVNSHASHEERLSENPSDKQSSPNTLEINSLRDCGVSIVGNLARSRAPLQSMTAHTVSLPHLEENP